MEFRVEIGSSHPVYWSFEGNCEVGQIVVSEVIKRGFDNECFAFVNGEITTIDGRKIDGVMVTVHDQKDVDQIDFDEVKKDLETFFTDSKPHIPSGLNFEFSVDWAKRLLAWIDYRNYSEKLGLDKVEKFKTYLHDLKA